MFRWINKWFTHNLWLKLTALFLAVISWLYINEEVQRNSRIHTPAFLSHFIQKDPIVSKVVDIKSRLEGFPLRDYKVQVENIIVNPSTCRVWGRRSIISDVDSIHTSPIDINNQTKTFITYVKIERISGIVLPEKTVVEVKVPIVKQ